LQQAAGDPENVLVVLPKTQVEQELVRAALPEKASATVIIPERALPGMQLLHNSDLAISGGGTMNREAALLGVPAYSMFTGRRAAIDEELARRNLLTFLETPDDIGLIEWRKRAISFDKGGITPTLLYDVSAMISKLKPLRNEPLEITA
jgi:predicted glycosyltransferase